jgi:hypothetical protein
MAEEAVIPGGPPDPIAFLRRLSSEVEALSLMDFKDDRKKRVQDPPARERPEVCYGVMFIQLPIQHSLIDMIIY